MCYPKPGPRCPSELKKRTIKLESHLNQADADDDLDAVERILAEKRQIAEEYLMTNKGLKSLKKRIEAGEDYDGSLQKRYEAFSRKRENSLERVKKIQASAEKAASHPATLHSLQSSLSYEGEVPSWYEEYAQESGDSGFRKPEIIDIIDSPAGKLAVVWEEDSTRDRERSMIQHRAMSFNRIAYKRLEDGGELGFVSVSSVDEESVKRSWGEDDWTSLRKAESHAYSPIVSEEEYDEATGDYILREDITQSGTPEESLEAKKNIWVRGHQVMELHPEGTTERLNNLSVSNAPDGEKLESDISRLRAHADKEMEDWKHDYKDPTISYSSLSHQLRGTGMGTSMYVYTARKLAEKGKILRSSDTQTPEAQDLWLRMKQTKVLPISKHKKIWKERNAVDEGYALDFRKK